MSLQDWFDKNFKAPMLLLGGLLFLVLIFMVTVIFVGNSNNQISNVSGLVSGIARVAITQKNRVLLESVVQRSVNEYGATLVAVCDGDKIVAGFQHRGGRCSRLRKSKVFESVFSATPAGYSDYKFVIYLSRLHGVGGYLWIVFVLAIFFIVLGILFLRIRGKIQKDLMSPMGTLLENDGDFEILEFNQLKVQIRDREQFAIQKNKAQEIVAAKKKLSHNLVSKISSLRGILCDEGNQFSKKSKNDFRSILNQLSEILDGLRVEVSSEMSQMEVGDTNFQSILRDAKKFETFGDISELAGMSVYRKLKELKNLGHKHIEILLVDNSGADNTYSLILQNEFSSILSNILNNSIEAGANRILVELDLTQDEARICIRDNGMGMDEADITEVFERQFTKGKAGGSGFGLFHAKTYLESWGGAIEVVQGVSCGLEVKIRLPLWGPPEKENFSASTVVIVDDSQSVHDIWASSVQGLSSINFVFLKSLAGLENWLGESEVDISKTLFFIDNDLKEKRKGVQAIPDFGLEPVAFLVSNSFDDAQLLGLCREKQVQFIPKPFIGDVAKLLSAV